ncbi:hypothetical protein [Halomicrobium sp. LC1Hm]|uniref:hypothetical protein n=1 Tax=Halomicrobium sp. LC1Hm TaxID=2610902 RepID=UPI0012A8B7FB|nr:hypothetical protein [Halomicrobium sp. LC1Hm]QGA82047.1 Rolling circle replication protein Rep [Halomicrobium sp. LC1Hm]
MREAVRWCSLDSVQAASESEIRDDLARRQWDDLDDLDAAIERAISDVEQSQVRSTLPEKAKVRCVVDYIGAYAYWDLLSDEPSVGRCGCDGRLRLGRLGRSGDVSGPLSRNALA